MKKKKITVNKKSERDAHPITIHVNVESMFTVIDESDRVGSGRLRCRLYSVSKFKISIERSEPKLERLCLSLE